MKRDSVGAMNWLVFAIIGTASLATTGILDKFILSRYIKNSAAYLVALILVQQLFAVLILVFKGVEFVYPTSVLALISGSFQIVLWVSYLRALQVEEVSRVMPLVFIYPLFVFAAAALFLGEVLTPTRYTGALMLVLSAVLVSYKPAKEKTSLVLLSPAVKYLFFFWVFLALYATTAKYLLSFMDEWELYFWTSLGNLIFSIPLLGNHGVRIETFSLFRKGPRVLGAILLEEIFDFLGRIGLIFAYALGSISLVSSVNALQPLIVLIYVILLSLFLPGILREEIGRETLAFKFAAVILVAFGMYFIT